MPKIVFEKFRELDSDFVDFPDKNESRRIEWQMLRARHDEANLAFTTLSPMLHHGPLVAKNPKRWARLRPPIFESLS